MVSGNVVGWRLPYFWMRQRHAIYVGNVNNLTVVDNRADLPRTGGSTDGTSVAAVRVWGLVSPFLQVRGLDLTGDFRFGALVRDTTPSGNRPRLVRHISAVLNLDGAQAVSVPATVTTVTAVATHWFVKRLWGRMPAWLVLRNRPSDTRSGARGASARAGAFRSCRPLC